MNWTMLNDGNNNIVIDDESLMHLVKILDPSVTPYILSVPKMITFLKRLHPDTSSRDVYKLSVEVEDFIKKLL